MEYRLGLDVGTNSIGWALLALNNNKQPSGIIRMGVRIFSDGRHPKSGESLAVGRRIPKSARRRRDRYLRRRDYFMDTLKQYNLMPVDPDQARKLQDLNPYELRAKALSEKLPLHHLGRALFHLNQRRGFKSNRKADKGASDGGKIKSAIKHSIAEMQGETVGQFLYKRQQQGEGTRARLVGVGAKAEYPFYVDRRMIEDEFERIWETQQQHYPDVLTEEKRKKLFDILFFQRDLKPAVIGKCFFHPDQELRAPIALPSSQLFRLYQEVNNLRLLEKGGDHEMPLTRSQRDELIEALSTKKELKYSKLRDRLFKGGRPDAFEFTIEQSGFRKSVLGDTTSNKLCSPKAFGKMWRKLDLAEKEAIVTKLLDTEQEQELISWLQSEYALPQEKAEYISNIGLEDGHLRIGRTAVSRILPYLMDGWNDDDNKAITYDKAVLMAGYEDHRQQIADELSDELPYYGEVLSRYTQDMPTANDPNEKVHGRIANPTVHIGLNQIRKLINAIIKKYGRPQSIVVELARELKQNKQQKQEANTRHKKNRENNLRLNQRLQSEYGVTPNAENRLRLKLYEELGTMNHCCVLSGDKIKSNRLFSKDYEIDHILPFSKTLDDSFPNKILVTHRANALKGRKSPYEAFGNGLHYNWEDIEARIQTLPYEKRKRFKSAAYAEWLGKHGDFEEDGKSFIARQLTDTAYLARVTKEYLQVVCKQVDVTPGRLTALLGAKWGFNRILSDANKKERTDHRHHAVDSVVIAMTDRKLLQTIATRAAKAEETNIHRLLSGIDRPEYWLEFYEDIKQASERIVISHKPDHNPLAALHEETAYGIVSHDKKKDVYEARVRIPLERLSKIADLDNLESQSTAEKLRHALDKTGEKDFKKAMAIIAKQPNMPKRVRKLQKISGVTVDLKGTAISPHKHKQATNHAKLYKGGGNYCYEIYVGNNNKWTGKVISTFVANQGEYKAFMKDEKHFRQHSFEGEKLIMRLIRGDMVAIEEDGKRRIMRIQKMTHGVITLAEHFESNADARHRAKTFRFTTVAPSSLQAKKGRKVFVNIMGYVLDPGFIG